MYAYVQSCVYMQISVYHGSSVQVIALGVSPHLEPSLRQDLFPVFSAVLARFLHMEALGLQMLPLHGQFLYGLWEF